MATTHIKRSTSASRLVNYAEKRAIKKDGLNLDIQYAKSEFKQVRAVYGNPGKTQAYASRIAFSPLEFNPFMNMPIPIRYTSMQSLARLTWKPGKKCTVIGTNIAIT
nr:relaxase/mobilization nuclease domain-containing protein [Lactiplantibacillus plantarum]